MPYELTQFRAYMQRFMKEIGDVLTSEEDLARYEDFNQKIKALEVATKVHYNNKLSFSKELGQSLRRAYEDALEAAALRADSQEEAGTAGLRLKTVAREMIPLMQADIQALDLIDRKADRENYTLPELIAQVRMQAADLGEAEIPEGGGPVTIRVESLDDLQTGTFIPAAPGAAEKPAAAYSRLAGILGMPDLVTRAQPMLLSHKGGTVAGTFIPRANGIDPAAIQENDPLLSFGPENLDTAAGISGIASVGLMDYLVGTGGRGSAYCMRFDRPYSTKNDPAKLVGLSVKPGSVRFDDAPVNAEQLKEQLGKLGVIPAEMVNLLTADGFEEQLRYLLHDCGLPDNTVNRILERRQILIDKIREDQEYYKDKAPGYTESGRIRVVPEAGMEDYHLEDLAAVNPDGPFAALKNLPAKTKEELERQAEERKARQARENAPQPALIRAVPTARLIGSGLSQEPDPYHTNRPETVKLHIPALGDKSVAGGVNTRYPVGWEENGRLRKGVFTLPKVHSVKARLSEILEPYLTGEPYAPYRDLFLAIRDYYLLSDNNKRTLELPPLDDLPWQDLGLTEARYNELKNNKDLQKYYGGLSSQVHKAKLVMNAEDRYGAERGERIEMRNVAMSEVGDVLGVPDLLARSTTAKVELGGKVVDGVFMEEAEGVDLSKVKPGTAPAAITEAMAPEVFNTKGLKDLADIQILDYICMNRDRHRKNMFYKFDGLETDHPRFAGVQGIDNDFSFGTDVPKDDEDINYLAALKDIKAISASLAARLREPDLMDRIAEKLRRNGLNEAQITAAGERFARIKKKLEKGKLEVVQDEQWGKGKYRIETLGAGDLDKNTSIFCKFKQSVVGMLTKMAKDHPVQPGRYAPMEELKVQKVERVSEFGDAVRRAEELQELEKQAEKAFLSQAEEAAKTGPMAENPEHQAIFELHATAAALKAQLDAGRLPWPWGSGTYRKMHSSCEDLLKFTGRLAEKLAADPQMEISEEDSRKLSAKIRDFSDKSAAYVIYKNEDLKTYAAGESTARRQEAANNSNEMMYSRYSSYKAARKERLKPLHLVHEKIREVQGTLGAASGEALREKAAQILYLNGLTRMELDKKSGMGVRRAMTGQKLAEQTERVLGQSAFKRLAALPDNELRALAAGNGGRDLADKFIREIAKEQQAKNAPKNQGYQAPQQEHGHPQLHV